MAVEETVDLGITGLAGAELIGTGGFATVYKAEQPAFRRTVAVKLLMVGRLDEETSHRFERECQLMGSLSEHPSIVTMFDAGFTAEGRPYLLMAYMPGGSLEDRLAASGPLPWREAVPICVRMAGALEVAHRADVVHRDVKPDNILLSSFGEPQLTDFGIARIAGGPETRSGIITASLAHAAPEVLDGQRPGVAADVYSLGSTLFALLAGEPAFTRATDESVFPLLLRIRSDPVPNLRDRGVPDAVCGAVEAAMAKDPADRPSSAQAFGELLRAAEREAGLAPTSLLLGFDTAAPGRETVRVAPPPEQAEEPEPVAPPEPVAASDPPGEAEPVAPQPPIVPPKPAARPETVTPPVLAAPPEPAARPETVTPPALAAPSTPAEAPPGPAPARRWWVLAGLGAVVAIVVVVVIASRGGDTPDGGDTGDPPVGVVARGELVPGEEVVARLEPGETHAYTFDGPEGIAASVEMRSPDPSADPYVVVRAPEGDQLAADDDLGGGAGGVDALAFFLMPIHGTYVVEASDRTGEASDYTIRVDFESVALLFPPVDLEGGLDFPPDARDFYLVEARAGQQIEVVMASQQPGFDPYVEIYGPAAKLGEDDDSGGGLEGRDARLVVEAPTDGSYRIVAGHRDDVGGRYVLTVNMA